MSSSNEKFLTEGIQKVEIVYLDRCARYVPKVRPRCRMSCRPVAPCFARALRRHAQRQQKKEAQLNPKPIVKGESSNAGNGANKITKTKAKSKATAAKGIKGPKNAGPPNLKD